MARQKKVNFDVILDTGSEPWQIFREVRAAHHPHLSEAQFVMAWRKALKCDKDGHIMLGKCKKAGDLDRDLAQYDFVIILNREHWEIFDRAQREALIDHELCHAAVATNKDGSVKYDERDRVVYRIRKHDIEEFTEVVERHGTYKSNLVLFAQAMKVKAKFPLLTPEALGEEPGANGEAAHGGRKPARPRPSRRKKDAV